MCLLYSCWVSFHRKDNCFQAKKLNNTKKEVVLGMGLSHANTKRRASILACFTFFHPDCNQAPEQWETVHLHFIWGLKGPEDPRSAILKEQSSQKLQMSESFTCYHIPNAYDILYVYCECQFLKTYPKHLPYGQVYEVSHKSMRIVAPNSNWTKKYPISVNLITFIWAPNFQSLLNNNLNMIIGLLDLYYIKWFKKWRWVQNFNEPYGRMYICVWTLVKSLWIVKSVHSESGIIWSESFRLLLWSRFIMKMNYSNITFY